MESQKLQGMHDFKIYVKKCYKIPFVFPFALGYERIKFSDNRIYNPQMSNSALLSH